MDSTWWAVALSEEVTGDKPLSVDIGDRPVVLWRDLKGQVRAPWRTAARTGVHRCRSAAFARKVGFSAAITAGATMARPAE